MLSLKSSDFWVGKTSAVYNGCSYCLPPPSTLRTDLPIPFPSAASEPWHRDSCQCHGPRMDTVFVSPSSESPLRFFSFSPQGKFLSSASSFLLQLHHPCIPRVPVHIIPVGKTCIAASAAVFSCPAQPPRGLWVL